MYVLGCVWLTLLFAGRWLAEDVMSRMAVVFTDNQAAAFSMYEVAGVRRAAAQPNPRGPPLGGLQRNLGIDVRRVLAHQAGRIDPVHGRFAVTHVPDDDGVAPVGRCEHERVVPTWVQSSEQLDPGWLVEPGCE